ncbi:MAG: hypothetical protein ABL962_08720 [Fimbriimonadaceae bacterium]
MKGPLVILFLLACCLGFGQAVTSWVREISPQGTPRVKWRSDGKFFVFSNESIELRDPSGVRLWSIPTPESGTGRFVYDLDLNGIDQLVLTIGNRNGDAFSVVAIGDDGAIAWRTVASAPNYYVRGISCDQTGATYLLVMDFRSEEDLNMEMWKVGADGLFKFKKVVSDNLHGPNGVQAKNGRVLLQSAHATSGFGTVYDSDGNIVWGRNLTGLSFESLTPNGSLVTVRSDNQNRISLDLYNPAGQLIKTSHVRVANPSGSTV